MPASNPKEAKLEGDANKSGDIDVIATQSALEEVERCQNEIDTINEKASEEILAVEQKFNKLRQPHFEKRNELINAVPNFWYDVFVNHPHIASMLNREDQDCLRCLQSIKVEEFEDIKSGYKIIFDFKENKYFTNSQLIKEFYSLANPGSKFTPIDWKEGKDLTKISPMKGRKRPLGGHSGFFSWFISNGDPNLDEIAETIKDDIWMNPLQYYLASDIEVGAENGHSDDEFDDDDEEEEEEDLDESVVVIGDDDSEDDDGDNGEEPEILEVGDDDEDDDEEGDDDDIQEVEGDEEQSGAD